MSSQGNLETLVLDYVLAKRKGRTPAHYEQVVRLTLPFYVEGFKVYKIIEVDDSGLVGELQKDDINPFESEGTVFEVNIFDRGSCRFYYVASDGRFILIAQDGNSHLTIGWLQQNGTGPPKTTEPSNYDNPPLEDYLEKDPEDTSLTITVAISRLIAIPGIERKTAKTLAVAGFDSVEKVAIADESELCACISNLSVIDAKEIKTQAESVLRRKESKDHRLSILSRLRKEKPIRVLKLPSIPEPREKPIKIKGRVVGRCTYCSGSLIEERGRERCRNCGKVQQTNRRDNDDWKTRAGKLRRELRR